MSSIFESAKYFIRHPMIFSSMATQIRIVRPMGKDLVWEHLQIFPIDEGLGSRQDEIILDMAPAKMKRFSLVKERQTDLSYYF